MDARRFSQIKLAVRAKADEIKMKVVGLPVNKDQVWFNVAIAVICPVAGERMIEAMMGQRLVGNKPFENSSQDGIKRFAVPS
jgi:hypothetical protein